MDGKIAVVLVTLLVAGIGMVFSGIMIFSGTYVEPKIAPPCVPIAPLTTIPTTPHTPSPLSSPAPVTPTPTGGYPIITYEPPSTRYGTFQLLISDAQADISDFESLNITFSHARVFKLGDYHSEAGFRVLEVTAPPVDLTQVVGEKAVTIMNSQLEAGKYTKIELGVANVEATLRDEVGGGIAEVQIPSEKLELVKPFEITEDKITKFVFDLTVVRKGQSKEYNLLPVIAESGMIGREIDEEKVQEI